MMHVLQTMLAYAFGGLGEVVHVKDYDGPGLLVREARPALMHAPMPCRCMRRARSRKTIKRTGKCWCLS